MTFKPCTQRLVEDRLIYAQNQGQLIYQRLNSGDYTEVTWLEFCKACGRKHRMKIRSCPTCNVYTTPQPASDHVLDQCHADYSCDGCQAYRDHTAI